MAVLLLGVAGPISGQTHAGDLKIVGPSRLTLDPVCNARTGASLISLLRNDGATLVPLALMVAEPVSTTPGRVALARAAIAVIGDAGNPAVDKVSLLPGELVRIRLDVTGMLDNGAWDIEVSNAGTPIGAVTVVSPQVPFAVKLDVATPGTPALSFERGKQATIPLKNDDGFGYQVSGQYTVRGVVKDAVRSIPLSATGGGELRLKPPKAWFNGGIRNLFKDDVADGRLTIHLSSNSCPDDPLVPARLFSVKTTLSAWPDSKKEWRASLLLLGTLFLGGVCSLALNFFLPAHGRRQAARARLSLVARRLDDVPMHTDPRVRNSLAVERRQLAERLKRLKFYDTQFSAEMTEIEQGFVRLGTRLDLLAQMELVLNRYWRERSSTLALKLSDDIEELRRQVNDFLRRSDPSDKDIQAVQTLINMINERLTTATAADPDLASRLAKAAGTLHDAFEPTGPIGASPVWQRLKADMGEDFAEVLTEGVSTDPANIAPADYVRLERAVFILEQIRDFIRLCGATGSSGFLTPEQEERCTSLMLNLRGGSWEQLKRAQRSIRQMREGIFHQDVETQIDQKRVAIEPSRAVVRQFEPTELRVLFLDRGVQGSAAREEYTCHWDFEYAQLKATGWSVSHFFPIATDPDLESAEPEVRSLRRAWRAVSKRFRGSRSDEVDAPPVVGPYTVKVRFVRDDGYAVPGEVSDVIHVRPPLRVKVRASFWIEWLRLFLALGVAAAGLIAGAREQILKLDVLPALIAVFLLGFGSDRIKNLFTERSVTSEQPKAAGTG